MDMANLPNHDGITDMDSSALPRRRALLGRGSAPVRLAISKRQQLVHPDDPQAAQAAAAAAAGTCSSSPIGHTIPGRSAPPPRAGVDNNPDVRVQVHQHLPAPPARAEHRDAVVADGDHVREGPRGAAPSRRGGAQDHQLRAGPAVEVRDVYPREDGVAVCAEGCRADLVCWRWVVLANGRVGMLRSHLPGCET